MSRWSRCPREQMGAEVGRGQAVREPALVAWSLAVPVTVG